MKFDEYCNLIPKLWIRAEEELLQEAIFASYGIESLIKAIYTSELKSFIITKHYEPNPLVSLTKYGKPTVVNFELKVGYPENTLKNILQVYGYFIARTEEDKQRNIIGLLVEPLKPTRIEPKTLEKIPYFYHITEEANVQKILKLGLNPRESTTNFKHPGDRVYLCYSDKLESLKAWKQSLLRNRDNIKTNSKMVILRVTKDTHTHYFLDESASNVQYNFIAVFTTKSINPSNIKITNL